MTFRLNFASFLSFFLITQAIFWQRKNIISFFHSNLSTRCWTESLDHARMKRTKQYFLFESVCNTILKLFTLILLLKCSAIDYLRPEQRYIVQKRIFDFFPDNGTNLKYHFFLLVSWKEYLCMTFALKVTIESSSITS